MEKNKLIIFTFMFPLFCVISGLSGQTSVPGLAKGRGYFSEPQGITLAPVGFVDYCRRHASACERADMGSHLGYGEDTQEEIVLVPEVWRRIKAVNDFVNHTIRPVSDWSLYRKAEYWEVPKSGSGDCEDYVLMKKKYLEEQGFARRDLLITVVLDEEGEGHAVLAVRTNLGDFVLDNRKDDILLWSKTKYVFLKRQSSRDPRVWVSLGVQKRSNLLNIAKQR